MDFVLTNLSGDSTLEGIKQRPRLGDYFSISLKGVANFIDKIKIFAS
jgi:hypothetical protein